MKSYLLCIRGDVEPEVIGPFRDEASRDLAARDMKAEHGDANGLFKLYATSGVQVLAFSAAELEAE